MVNYDSRGNRIVLGRKKMEEMDKLKSKGGQDIPIDYMARAKIEYKKLISQESPSDVINAKTVYRWNKKLGARPEKPPKIGGGSSPSYKFVKRALTERKPPHPDNIY